MSDQILSQEEIDALLSAMDSGEIDLEGSSQEDKTAKPYNLASQSITLRDQFSVLEEVYAKFLDLLQVSLRSLLQRDMEVAFVSQEIKKFADMIKTFGTPTFFNVFQMEPLFGSALLAIKPGLVFSLIDCLFGGTGKAIETSRNFTKIEQRMMEKVSSHILRDLEKAWEIVCPVNIGSKKIETRPAFMHAIDPNDYVVNIVFALKGGALSGDIQICIPYLMLEPIKDRLSFKYLREREREHAWNVPFQQLLQDAEVEMVVELARTQQTVGHLLSWKTDDVVRLDRGPEDPVIAYIEGVPKLYGFPGILKGSRAVQVRGPLKQNGGN